MKEDKQKSVIGWLIESKVVQVELANGCRKPVNVDELGIDLPKKLEVLELKPHVLKIKGAKDEC
jgi:hypothetical protein